MNKNKATVPYDSFGTINGRHFIVLGHRYGRRDVR